MNASVSREEHGEVAIAKDLSKEAYDGVEIIEKMSREDFHSKFVKGVGQTRAFSALASFTAENISPEEKQEIRTALSAIGIPLAMTELDDVLDEIAAVVSARAVTLR